MNVLVFAIENGRWGPARLPHMLHGAGLRVAVLCPADNALAATSHAERRFPLPARRGAAALGRALSEAIQGFGARLVIPGDDQAVALMHAILRRAPRAVDKASLGVVAASLGDPDRLDASLLKTDTMALARELGVPVPRSRTVATMAEAEAAAAAFGWPVYVKQSFGWAGAGVRRCTNPEQLAQAIGPVLRPVPAVRRIGRALLGRDWYPIGTAVDVQEEIPGERAMFCALAWRGELVAGFSAVRCMTVEESGPSTVVRLRPDPAMTQSARTLLRALGATGFFGLDFIIGRDGVPRLIESNPRPNQVLHLGTRVGIDMGAALSAAIAGRRPSSTSASGEEQVALFPQEWMRDPGAMENLGCFVDVPWHDAELLSFSVAYGLREMRRNRGSCIPGRGVDENQHRSGTPGQIGPCYQIGPRDRNGVGNRLHADPRSAPIATLSSGKLADMFQTAK